MRSFKYIYTTIVYIISLEFVASAGCAFHGVQTVVGEENRIDQDEHHDSYSLVLAWPLTGRMHQIRAHFAHLGFPLAGDVRYAPRKGSTAWSGERLFLHAAFISVPSSLTAVSPLKVDLLEPLKDRQAHNHVGVH